MVAPDFIVGEVGLPSILVIVIILLLLEKYKSLAEIEGLYEIYMVFKVQL